MTSPAAIVTGASRRIGRAIALHLAKSGYDIAIHYNTSSAAAQTLQREIRDMGQRAELFAADLKEPEDVQVMADEIFASFQNITLLVNNASMFEKGTMASPLPEFQNNLNIHLLSPLVLMQTFALHVKEGLIVNFLDSAITDDGTPYVPYLLSKKSLSSLTRMAAVELAPGIRVNGIAPGPILPPPGQKDGQLQKRAASLPLQKAGTIDDILRGIDYLIHSPFVTGEILYIDGGQHLKRYHHAD